MMAANATMMTMLRQTQLIRRTAAVVLVFNLIASLLPAMAVVAVAAEQGNESRESAVELDVPAGRDLETWFRSAAWRDWLGDLHTLGLRPAVMVADHRRILAAEPD